MLKTRIATALVLITLVMAALFTLPPRAWGVVILAGCCAAAYEWALLSGFTPVGRAVFVLATGVVGVLLLFLPAAGFDQGWRQPFVLSVCGAATVFWVLLAPAWLAGAWSMRSPVTYAIIGWLVLIGTWFALVELQARSPWLVLATMAVVWLADTAAYFTGRRFGRHKLAPSISPGKTWEGVLGALVAACIYGLLLLGFAPRAGYAQPLSTAAIALWLLLMLALTTLSVIGDLFESKLKRERGVKDSGSLLPGHGGVLDRIDALLAAMPPAALMVVYLLH